MAEVAGGGGGSRSTPSIGQPSYVYNVTWGGVTFVVNKKTNEIILPGGKRLPAGSSLNVSKQTIDLPGGKHLTFSGGKVIANTPVAKRDRLAPTTYTQVDFLTGKPVAAPKTAPARSGDDRRTPAPQPKPQPAAPKPTAPAGGRTRDEVRQLQQWLNSQGANLVVDGIYGPKTKAAEAQYGKAAGTGGGGAVPGAAAGGGAGGAAGGGANTTAGPVAPAPSGAPLNQSQVDAEVRRMFGADMASFLGHAELGPILRKAASEGWDQSRLFGAIQQTKYWQTTGESTRKWTIQKTLDPATAKANIDQQTTRVAEMIRSWGLAFTPEQQRYFAELSLKNGWSDSQIREHLFAREATGAKDTGALDTNIAQNYGYLAAYLDEPEVGDLLRRAAREGWTPARLEVELRKTNFWKTTTDAQRQWDATRKLNPADAKAQRDNRAQEITAMAQQLGVRLDPARLGEIADESMRFGWSQTQIKNAVTAEYQYGGGTQPGERTAQTGARKGPMSPAERAGVVPNVATPEGDEFGMAGQTARQIREMAGQYLVPISEQMLEKWTEQIVRGTTDMEGFNSYLVEQAKSLFPGMAGALDKGVTVAQYADPYRQIAARELELNPESIDLNDPRFRKMLDQTDSKGNRVSMTLSESAEYLRRLPEWQQTRGANEKAASLTENILKTFGAVA